MRIALLAPITHSIPPVGYGPWELVVYNLAEALVDLGEDVTIFATKECKTRAKVRSYVDEPLLGRDDINHTAASHIHIINSLHDAENFDIIHNHFNIQPVLFSTLIKTPLVTTLHAAAREAENSLYYDALKERNFVSLSMAERSFRPDLNYVGNVYNGVDFSRYKLRGGGEYLLFSGRIEKEKGILSALEISKKSGIPLKIAGIITNPDFYHRYVEPSVDGKNIELLGNLNYEQLSSALEHAIALVAMVEWNDTCPLSVIDALASGVPVIGSAEGALPEMITESDMGYIAKNVDDAVAKIDQIKNTNSSNCRELARQVFSREVMAEKYLEIYRKLVQR